MRLIRRWSLTALAVFGTACQMTSEPIVKVRVVVAGAPDFTIRDLASASSTTSEKVMFDIPVRIDNDLDAEIVYMGCGTSLERRFGEEWKQVWAALCSTGNQEGISIPAKSSPTLTVKVRGTKADLPFSFPTGSVEGQYRFRMLLTKGGKPLTRDGILSDIFRLL